MTAALIGYSGFVGSTLLKQNQFNHLYRSNNINEINDKEFELVVCAAASAQKWIANKEPQQDLLKINELIKNLETIKTKKFILISTVDVFKDSTRKNEDSLVDEIDLHPYGLHRRLLEKFVQNHFKNHLIVRLPGLVGPGLRKNIIYDFHNKNNLTSINSEAVFQFYPMVNLWYDIQIALQHEFKIIHLTAEPLSVADIAKRAFNLDFTQSISNEPARYDFQTKYSKYFNSTGNYQYSKDETILATRAYAQSEPHSN